MSWKQEIEAVAELQKRLRAVTAERDELKVQLEKQHKALVNFRKAYWEADRELLAGFYGGK